MAGLTEGQRRGVDTAIEKVDSAAASRPRMLSSISVE
jgi:hypothetical protein